MHRFKPLASNLSEASTPMSNRLKYIDKHQAAAYEQLAAREDQPGNLFAALNEINLMDGVGVVEFGAGKVIVPECTGIWWQTFDQTAA